ncbi:Alpha/Beta hydrolase protein [Aspergillus flavus]|uniref:Alpha/Beta hydrolase protein n=1 Tax=Aspergillus flavus TaxID=5059 RepID=A0A5N6HIM0_ASPFL|nr:Alpha/Beta hydrolase protein [Aspergillus flavus]
MITQGHKLRALICLALPLPSYNSTYIFNINKCEARRPAVTLDGKRALASLHYNSSLSLPNVRTRVTNCNDHKDPKLIRKRWISPSTDEAYKQYMQSRGAVPQTIELEYGAKGHWIGNKNARNVLIWYHGGGFCLPANVGYFKFWESLIQCSSAAGKDLAVFAVAYTLAPNAQYPTQLIQSVEGLRYILTETNRTPANILLGGDSAGGNLAVGVLSHLSSPHEAIAKLDVQEPLAGTVLIAPWTSLEVSADTKMNCLGDVITPDVAKPWSQAYLGRAKHDYYTDARQNEIMLPSIRHFVDKVKSGFPSIELFIGRQEGHVAPVYNLYMGDNKETQQGERLKVWLGELL